MKNLISRRLKRLVTSGVCPAEDASKYATELRQLANEVIDLSLVAKQSRLFKALSDETRLRILKLLSLREMCVCEVMVALDLTQPTASHHLNLLQNVGLVEDRKEGKWVFYSIAKPELVRALQNTGLL
ncbi:MAG: metalloregulator ArsR/SmtB family transcription factor [Candidatus Bathyarchaeota archaeon]|nr:metalloregulator ArsR/SmtB family transcription factor [Candidatus Bathyarchaeota archaeon]